MPPFVRQAQAHCRVASSLSVATMLWPISRTRGVFLLRSGSSFLLLILQVPSHQIPYRYRTRQPLTYLAFDSNHIPGYSSAYTGIMNGISWRDKPPKPSAAPSKIGPSTYQNTISKARGKSAFNQPQNQIFASSSRAPYQNSQSQARSTWNPNRPEVVFNDRKDYMLPHEFERGSKYPFLLFESFALSPV
jgi:hypothetical protein